MAVGDGLQYAGEYKLEKCELISSTGVRARLDARVSEINIFESIFSQFMIVSIVITDLENLIMNMPIIGQEYIRLKVSTPTLDSIDYTDNVLCVTKVTSRQDLSKGAQVYELTCISPESLRNNRTKIKNSYDGKISDIVVKVLKDERLINTNKNIFVDETLGNKKFVVPNMRPFDFINSLSKQTQSTKFGGSPNYFFFENTRGFHFRVLDSLYDEDFRGKFIANESDAQIDTPSAKGNFEKDFQRIKSFAIGQSNDTLLSSRGGMLSSRLIKYNIFEKNFSTHTFNYFDNFKDYGRIDKNPIYNKVVIDKQDNNIGDFNLARTQLQPTSNSDGLDARYTGGNDFTDNSSEFTILPRRSKVIELQNGLSMQLKAHGHCNLAVGDKVFITLPVSGSDHGDKKIETIYNGEFLVTQLRHVLQTEDRRHSFVMNVNKDSTSETFRNQSTAKEPVGKKGSVTIL